MIKSTIATLAVFGALASVCDAQLRQNRGYLDFKPTSASIIDRSYIKTLDGKKLPRKEEPVAVVTTTSPDEKTVQSATGTIRCLLWKNCILLEEAEGDAHTWECTFDNPGLGGEYAGYRSKEIVSPDGETFNEFFKLNGAESGKTVLIVAQALLTEGQMIVDPDDVIGLEDYDDEMRPTGRRLAPTSGTLKTLVARVVAQDLSPPSAVALSDDVFGDEWCLKSQYEKCSHGQFLVQEYVPGDIPEISHVLTADNAPGVVELPVAVNADGNTNGALQSAANTALFNLLGGDPGTFFDLVLFCMPPGTGTWIAYAYLNRWDSYYNDDWCQYMSSHA